MAVAVTISHHSANPGTIANRLAARLKREPTHAECVAEVMAILRNWPESECVDCGASLGRISDRTVMLSCDACL